MACWHWPQVRWWGWLGSASHTDLLPVASGCITHRKARVWCWVQALGQLHLTKDSCSGWCVGLSHCCCTESTLLHSQLLCTKVVCALFNALLQSTEGGRAHLQHVAGRVLWCACALVCSAVRLSWAGNALRRAEPQPHAAGGWPGVPVSQCDVAVAVTCCVPNKQHGFCFALWPVTHRVASFSLHLLTEPCGTGPRLLRASLLAVLSWVAGASRPRVRVLWPLTRMLPRSQGDAISA